jgi:hypothetical protein
LRGSGKADIVYRCATSVVVVSAQKRYNLDDCASNNGHNAGNDRSVLVMR